MINQYGEFYIPLGDLHNQEEEPGNWKGLPIQLIPEW
jgi:hypothetical protein